MSKQQLIIKAQSQIARLLLTIQAERDPFEWDKMRGIERASDGKFAPKGSGVNPNISQAQKSLSDLSRNLLSLPKEITQRARELLNAKEIQSIHEATEVKLESLNNDFGKSYAKTVGQLNDYDPKRIADFIKNKFDNLKGASAEAKNNRASIAQSALVGIEIAAAIAVGVVLFKTTTKSGKILTRLNQEKAELNQFRKHILDTLEGVKECQTHSVRQSIINKVKADRSKILADPFINSSEKESKLSVVMKELTKGMPKKHYEETVKFWETKFDKLRSQIMDNLLDAEEKGFKLDRQDKGFRTTRLTDKLERIRLDVRNAITRTRQKLKGSIDSEDAGWESISLNLDTVQKYTAKEIDKIDYGISKLKKVMTAKAVGGGASILGFSALATNLNSLMSSEIEPLMEKAISIIDKCVNDINDKIKESEEK